MKRTLNQVTPVLVGMVLAASLISPQAAQADKGLLRIVTKPGDAQIRINGKIKGNSPAEEVGQSFVIKLDEGEYQVEAVKPSGDRMEQYDEKKVVVADDTMQTITLELTKKRLEESARKAQAAYVPNPEMVYIPAGTFMMGCQGNDTQCDDDEKPALEMNVPAFEIGKYEVTFEMWDACYAQGGCDQYPDDRGWGRGNRPVINVSWNDIQKFLVWINTKTGKNFRLPTEPEWEYAARAGTTTVYSWGDAVGTNKANCDRCGSRWDNKQTAPVGSFAPNPWGVHDMHGNVWEWVSGCPWRYNGSSTNALDWKDATSGDCGNVWRVLRGGSWDGYPWYVRAANRDYYSPESGDYYSGFRLARTK